LAILPDERYPQQRITEAQKRINEAAGIDEPDDNVSEEEVSVAKKQRRSK
jgi:hypothetical protein